MPYRMNDKASLGSYLESFSRMLDLVRPDLGGQMPDQEEIAYKYISSLGSHYQQLKAAINNKTQACPKTLAEAQEMADGFMPLEALAKTSTSASFATKSGGGTSSGGSGSSSSSSKSSSNNNNAVKYDCSICKKYFPLVVDKKHYASDCPNIKGCLPKSSEGASSSNSQTSAHNIVAENSAPPLNLLLEHYSLPLYCGH